MLESSFVYFIMRTLPESIILMFSGYMLLGVEIKDKIIKIIIQGIILAVFIYVVRSLPINFGIHTILSMIIQGLIIYRTLDKNIVLIMVATCEVWLSLILSEAIFIPIALKVMNLPIEFLTDNKEIESAIATLPSLLILIIIIILFKYFNKKTILKGREECQ